MKKSQFAGSATMLVAAFFWGTTFVAQSIGASLVEPFTYIFCRSLLAVIALTPIIMVLDRISPKSQKPQNKSELKLLLTAGISSGTILTLASFLQQKGMETTTVGKSSFLTAFYIILVPIVGLFFKKKVGLLLWIGVLLSIIGLYLLCINPEDLGSIVIGDILIFFCAFGFTVQILIIDHFSPLVDCVRMSRIQFATVTVLSFILMFVTETPTMPNIWAAKWAWIYAGIFSSCVAYTCQIIAQEKLNPTLASIIMSLESVFGLLSGWVFLHEALSTRELIGCALMFIAILLAQMPTPKFLSHKNPA